MPDILNIDIKSEDKNYPIFINNDDIGTLKENILKEVPADNYVVVIAYTVYKLYKNTLKVDKDKVFVLKDGETEKNFKNYEKILKFFKQVNLTRKSLVIAIGGGVVGDIAGFAAATYMRGVQLVQVPTTLLAMVDSSVGGKVAINTEYGKNVIGAFYQPKAVFINLGFLDTLDNRQFKSGIAEILKYAFIEKSCGALSEHGLFDFLFVHSEKLLEKNDKYLEKVIKVCIDLKASVVLKDEKESSFRKILNFGHTYAHALETITGYKSFAHGEAVAFGIFMIFKYALKSGTIDANYKEKAFSLMHKYGFVDIKQKYDSKKLIEIMKADKKAEHDHIKVIVPTVKGFVKESDLDIEVALLNKLI